jgi:23S rRNA-/tRNA-specific pseudouridylate synthase
MSHTVLDLLESDHGIHAYGELEQSSCSFHSSSPAAVNRLDRLTSGLMILALSSAASRELANEFHNREIKKEYVARVRGRFPE